MHNEIKLRISAANKGYFALGKLFKSKLLSIRSKSTLYSSYLYDQFYHMDAKRGRSRRAMKRSYGHSKEKYYDVSTVLS